MSRPACWNLRTGPLGLVEVRDEPARRGKTPLHTTGPLGLIEVRDDAPVRQVQARPLLHGWRVRWLALLVFATAGAISVPLLAGHAASAPSSPAVPRIDVHRAAELPVADLGFVQMRDHLTTTIGAGAGKGEPLGDLLVVADTTLAAGAAFPAHRHAGVEVVTLVVDGTLTHEESGHDVELPAGTAQLLTAGAGLVHAEANRGDRPVRYLQLWLAGAAPGLPPVEALAVATPHAPLAFAHLRPDVRVRPTTLAPGAPTSWTVAAGRVAYVVCVGGALALDTVQLGDGDGATLIDGRYVATATDAGARLVVIDLPAPVTVASR